MVDLRIPQTLPPILEIETSPNSAKRIIFGCKLWYPEYIYKRSQYIYIGLCFQPNYEQPPEPEQPVQAMKPSEIDIQLLTTAVERGYFNLPWETPSVLS